MQSGGKNPLFLRSVPAKKHLYHIFSRYEAGLPSTATKFHVTGHICNRFGSPRNFIWGRLAIFTVNAQVINQVYFQNFCLPCHFSS